MAAKCLERQSNPAWPMAGRNPGCKTRSSRIGWCAGSPRRVFGCSATTRPRLCRLRTRPRGDKAGFSSLGEPLLRHPLPASAGRGNARHDHLFRHLARTGASRYSTRPARRVGHRTYSIMPKITYIDHEGTARTVEGEIGATVMETAIKNGIPGIEAECGGACACATCHVHVDQAWRAVVGEPSPMEEDMLDFGYDVQADSRLSCQIKVTAELEGLVVRTPERQA